MLPLVLLAIAACQPHPEGGAHPLAEPHPEGGAHPLAEPRAADTRAADGASPEAPSAEAGDDLRQGRRLFRTACIACHGVLAEGDGPARDALRPPPADLTAPRYQAWSAEQLADTARAGVPGTAMVGFGDILSRDEFQGVAAWLATLPRGGGGE